MHAANISNVYWRHKACLNRAHALSRETRDPEAASQYFISQIIRVIDNGWRVPCVKCLFYPMRC